MKTRILIADDEELERRALRKILEAEPDLEIAEAENGLQALEALSATPITVVLLDIKMPGLDGIAAAERLRREHPDVAVVFLTAYDQFGYARAALRLRVDDFLLKPASASEVLTTVRRVLHRVASRDGERESSRAALVRLDGAISLVADRLRNDLSEGHADPEQIHKFLALQGLTGGWLAVLEGRTAQAYAGMNHVARLAEHWFSSEGTAALAGNRGDTIRILPMGAESEEPGAFVVRLRKFRDAVRLECGCSLVLGAALPAVESVHPDTLVAAAHRAAAVASPANPVLVVVVGAEGTSAGAGRGPFERQGLPLPVSRTLDLLESRLTEDLSLNDVASAVGLSPSHLSRQLARATGRGFAECLTLLRIAAAKRYLAGGGLTIKEVAPLVGFHDPAYFARVFRRLEGRSPADFRAGIRSGGAPL